MAPKKKEVQKLSLGEFMNNDAYGGSWADEVEDSYASGTQPLPPSERRTGAPGGYGGYSSIRDNLPQQLPTKPPYTAHLGNLSYDATVESVNEFFTGCNIVSVRIIEDREQNRPKGFAYAEFGDLEGLKQALTLDGQSFQSRNIRIKVADPPKEKYGGGYGAGGDAVRDLSSWERKGPLEDLPGRNTDRNRDFGSREFSERRPLREPHVDGRTMTWERRGPLSPLPQPDGHISRDTSRGPTMERGESYRGKRRDSPQWGTGEGRQESRPPRERAPERVPSAAEQDNAWRSKMRPDAPVKSPGQSRDGSEAPPSPAISAAAPASRPKLHLAKRTVSEAPDVISSSATGDAKASPFGAARPIDTATREKEIEVKRLQAIKEKKEAEEKDKEERRLAKEASAKEAADKAEAEDKAQAEAEAKAQAEAARQAQDRLEEKTEEKEGSETAVVREMAAPAPNGASTAEKTSARVKENAGFKSRATESGNWRQSMGDRGASTPRGAPIGPRRGGPGPTRGGGRSEGRQNSRGSGQAGPTEQASPTPVQDEEGWTKVPNKGRRGQGRAMA